MPRLPSHPLAAIALTLFVVLSTTGGAIAHANTTETPTIFYSDDADTGSSGNIIGDSLESFSSSEDLNELGKNADLMFASANPEYIFNINGQNQTYAEWRSDQINNFPEGTYNSSVRPVYECVPHGNGFNPDAPNPDKHDSCDKTQEPRSNSWTFIQDAHTTIVGVEDGVYNNAERLPKQGARLKEQRAGQTLWIPGSGEVYVQSDFRAEPLSDTCSEPEWEYEDVTRNETRPIVDEDFNVIGFENVTVEERIKVDGERECTLREYTNSSVTHELLLYEGAASIDRVEPRTLAKKTVDTGGATLSYNDVSREQRRNMFVKSEYRLVYTETEQTQDWDPDTKWSVESESTTTTEKTRTGNSRELPVVITTSQYSNIEQRIINIENSDQTYVFVDFNTPYFETDSKPAFRNFRQQRLWSKLYLGEEQKQYVQNVWGVYSARQYSHANKYVADEDDPETIHQPPQSPAMYMTSETDKPRVKMVDYEHLTSKASVKRYNSWESTQNAPSFRQNVNLSANQPTHIDYFMLRDSPGGITRAEDIHGDEIPVETHRATGRIPRINISTIEGERVEVKVTDPETNEPLNNRTMDVSGAKKNVYTTNESGVVVLNRTGSALTVTTRPDDFTKDKDMYYVQSTASQSYLASPLLMALIFDLLRSIAFVIPFAVLYWIIDHAQEIEGMGQK